MARVTYVKKAQQRYATVPVIDPETGKQKVTPVLKKNGEPRRTKRGVAVVMRVTVADKTKPLPNLKCEKCGTEIAPGMPYKHVTPKSGPYGGRQRNRCQACPSWKPSELTSSPALGTLYAAQESFEEDLSNAESVEDIEAALNALAEGVREAGEVYTEGADNMESGFGHETSASEELREKASTLESAADEIESAVSDLEEFDEDAARAEVEDETLQEFLAENDLEAENLEAAKALDDFDAEAFEARMSDATEDARNEHLEEQKEKAAEAAEAANAL